MLVEAVAFGRHRHRCRFEITVYTRAEVASPPLQYRTSKKGFAMDHWDAPQSLCSLPDKGKYFVLQVKHTYLRLGI